MEVQEVVEDLRSRGYLISREALDRLSEAENPEELAKMALENAKDKPIIELTDFEQKIKSKISPDLEEVKKIFVEKTTFKPAAKDVETKLKIIGNDGADYFSSGTLEDFVDYFRDRFERESEILKGRGNITSLVNIENLKKKRGEKVRLLGMISEKKITKNGHFLFRLEDLSGSISALIPFSNKRMMNFGGALLLDDVVGIEGRLSNELFIIDQIFQPDIPQKETKMIEEDISLALISDMQIGSKLFLRKNFERFLAWLRGEVGDEKLREQAGKVKYLTVCGDVVDGIGIYPGQENSLDITDIFDQYKLFSEFMLQVPDYIHIIVCPGNHDAVKTADPQPRLPKELVPELYERDNVTLLGSPGMVEIHGLKTLIYHGTSFDDMVAELSHVSYEESESVMIESLKRRHVHPIYGGRPITPGKKDHLIIEEIPDIFHTGHIHRNGYANYKGVICVNSGTWQQVTPYEIKLGHKPTPCILPLIEMKYGRITPLHFDRQEI